MVIIFYIQHTQITVASFLVFLMSSQNSFSGLKPNKEKCEVAGIGVKKGVKVALCGMKNINLKK